MTELGLNVFNHFAWAAVESGAVTRHFQRCQSQVDTCACEQFCGLYSTEKDNDLYQAFATITTGAENGNKMPFKGTYKRFSLRIVFVLCRV